MAAPLLQFTKGQQRSVIRLLWSEGVKTGEIYRMTTIQCGNNCMNQRKIYDSEEDGSFLLGVHVLGARKTVT